MATTIMSAAEHRQVALDFLAASDVEFEAGDILQGAEKLWGASAHAVMAAALERGWQHESHRAMKNAAINLSRETGDPLIEYGFIAAEAFHKHFYRDSMEDFEREANRPLVHDFVRRVLAVA